MKLYYLLIQPLQATKKPISARNAPSSDAHEAYVTTHLSTFTPFLLENPGIHHFKHDSAYYYVQSSASHIAVCVTDSELSADAQHCFFAKLTPSTTTQNLQKLLQDPLTATQTSTEKILQDLDVLKQQMSTNLNKIIERGHKLDDLQIKTDQLQETCNQFKIKSTALKRNLQCPSLFTLYYAVKNFFWREAATYEFEPAEIPQKPKKTL